MKYFTLILTALALSACTIEQQGAQTVADFHPPLTYATWETEHYTTAAGAPSCVITSGHNGLSVLMRAGSSDDVAVSVKGNRVMPPGTTLSVSVAGNMYRTRDAFFAADDAAGLAQDLTRAEKAYLEWNQPFLESNGRQFYNNILKLGGFAQQFEACRQEVSVVRPVKKSRGRR